MKNSHVMFKNEQSIPKQRITCVITVLMFVLYGIIRYGIISTSNFDVPQPRHNSVVKDNNVVATFLDNNIRDVINATVPTYIPYLNNDCFWEKTR